MGQCYVQFAFVFTLTKHVKQACAGMRRQILCALRAPRSTSATRIIGRVSLAVRLCGISDFRSPSIIAPIF